MTLVQDLRRAAEVVRRADWLSELLVETRSDPSPSELAALQSAVSRVTGGVADTVAEIADLIEDPEADPIGSGADLIAGLATLIEGLVDLVDQLSSTVGATLQLDNALGMLILLLARALDELQPGASGALWALGLIEYRELPADTQPVPLFVRRPAAHRLTLLFTDPQAYLVDRIHDRESPLSPSGPLSALAFYTGQPLLTADEDVDWLNAVQRVRDDAMSGTFQIDHAVLWGHSFGDEAFAGVAAYITDNDANDHVRLGVAPIVRGLTERTFELDRHWRLRLAAELPLPSVALELDADPGTNTIDVEAGAAIDASVSATAELSRVPTEPGPQRALGQAGDITGQGMRLGPIAVDTSKLEVGLSVGVEVSTDVQVALSAALKQLKVGLSFDDADSFLQGVVPQEGLVAGFDLEVDWTEATGFVVRGAVGLELVVPLSVSIGPITLDRLILRAAFDGETVEFEAATGVRGEIGPLQVTVERMGVTADMTFPERGGNLGPVQLDGAFRPPSGVGLALEAGPVTGAGYISLEPEIGRYSGFLALRVSEFAVTALGLVQVDLPQPGPDYSLLILITAEFPGIQIGYGLTLNGIGGVFGLHRKIDADALRGDVSSGSVSTILDPGSRLDNPAQLISQLERYFPTALDHFVIGISLQLRWVELVRLDVGVLIELPGPNKIVILGRALIQIGSDDAAIVRIQVEVLGIIDFEARLLSIDAALRDSSLLEVFEITGGAAIRLSWGDRPYVVISIGGFHPEFVPEPAVIPVPERVGLAYGEPDDWFYLRLATYTAITTGSFQLGAAVEVRIDLEVISAEGILAFDALIVFDPFYFSVGFAAAFRVKILGISVAGVSMKGVLSGPGPVTFAGDVCIEILFLKACWSGSFSIGSDLPAEIADVDSVVDRLAAELRPDALRAEPSAWSGVTLTTNGEDTALYDPAGGLSWSQGLVPLGVIVERLEGTPLAASLEVGLHFDDGVLEDALDWFAPAAYLDLTDAEALTRKSFERLRAGFVLLARDRHLSPGSESIELRPEVHVLGQPEPTEVEGDTFPAAVLAAASGRHAGAAFEVDAALGLREETWEVHPPEGAAQETSSETAAHQLARHRGGVALPAGDAITVGGL